MRNCVYFKHVVAEKSIVLNIICLDKFKKVKEKLKFMKFTRGNLKDTFHLLTNRSFKWFSDHPFIVSLYNTKLDSVNCLSLA